MQKQNKSETDPYYQAVESPICPEHRKQVSRPIENGYLRCPSQGCKYTRRSNGSY